MGASSFTDYIKKTAREQATVSGGTTTFMQTGELESEAYETIRQVGGPGEYAFVVDVLTLLIREHWRIAAANPPWLKQADQTAVSDALDHHDRNYLAQLEQRVRSATGAETLIVFVVDGALRPAAKAGEMAKRARRRANERDKQKRLACGAKKVDILDLHTDRPWMASNNNNTIWLRAHDEADVLIGHLVSWSHPAGHVLSTPVPDHEHFERADVQLAISRLTSIAVQRRTIISRDTDLTACNVGCDVGLFLWVEWSGELDDLKFASAAPAPARAPAPAPAAPPPAAPAPTAAPAPPPSAAGPMPAPTPTATASTSAPAATQITPTVAAVNTGAQGQVPAAGAHLAGRRATQNVVGLRHAHGTAAAARPRRNRCKIPKLDTTSGNYVLLDGRGLDALPALGGDRTRRIRAWCMAGTDYLRSGVPGVTFKVIASGLLDELLAQSFESPSYERDLTEFLSRMASPSVADRSWRGEGRFGRVRKLGQVVAPEGISKKLLEAFRIGRGLCAERYIRANSVSAVPPSLDYGDRPPVIDRDDRTASSSTCSPAPTHNYLDRPREPGQAPNASETNPRRQNPIQPKRPNEGGKGMPSKSRVRPLASGESIVSASLDYPPEPIEIDAESLRRHREAVEEAKRREAEYAAKKAEWAAIRKKEQEEKEANGDDEFEVREDKPVKGAKKGLNSVYECVMSHEEPIAAAFRDFRAEPLAAVTATATTATTTTTAAGGRCRHKSGAQQRRAVQGRLSKPPPLPAATTSHPEMTRPPAAGAPTAAPSHPPPSQPSASSPAPTTSAPLPNPPPLSPRAPVLPPVGTASLGVVTTLAWLGMELSIDFVTASYRALTVERLDSGEAGIKLVSDAAIKRNGVAFEHGRLALFADPDYDGSGLQDDKNYREELSTAAAAARDAGIAVPPTMPLACFTQAFIPIQTAIKAIPEQWLLTDLYNLGGFLMADPHANAGFMLGFVFADKHETFEFSTDSEACLAALDTDPDAASRFRSKASDLLGQLLRDTPFSPRTAKAGAEDPSKRQLPKGTRASQRKGIPEKSQATRESLFGITSSVPQAASGSAAPTAEPATAQNSFAAEKIAELRAEVEKLVKATNKATKDDPLPDSTTNALADDLLEVAFRLLCFRDRHIDVALNLNNCKKKAEIEGKKLVELLKGKAPIAPEKFRTSLLALTITLRRMLDTEESRLLPFFDPTWICFSITDLVLLSEEPHLSAFISSLVEQVTAAVHHLLPTLQHVDDHGAEILSLLRENFDLEQENGNSWPWQDAERTGARAGVDPQALAAVLGSRARLRPHLLARASAVGPALRSIFGLDTTPSVSGQLQVRHAKVELVNVVARRAVQAQNLIPTGMVQVSAHHVRFFCAKLTSVKEAEIGAAAGLDAGLFWSKVAQRDWSVLTLADYYDSMTSAYEVKRSGQGGLWSTTRIVPVAEPSKEAMDAHRRLLVFMPNATPLPRHDKARLQLRLQCAAERTASRSRHPSDLRAPTRRARLPERTRDGLPSSWGDGRTAQTRERLDNFIGNWELDHVGFVGVDQGVKRPIAVFSSTPSSAPGVMDGRAEASVVYGRNRLLSLERRNSAEMAHINSNLGHQLDRGRFSRHSSTQLRPPSDTNLIEMWLGVLKKGHPVRERVQLRYGIEREAEIRSVASEIGSVIGGGNTRNEVAGLKWVVFVGDGMTATTGQSGAAAHNTILRHLPIELRRRGMATLFVRVPESYTSKRCCHPRCRRGEDDSKRSEADVMSRTDGSCELRLLRCRTCGDVFDRDGGAAANMVGMGLSLWSSGRPLWGALIEE